VTSAVAAAGLAGIPVTHRGLSQSFTVVSGHVPPGDPRSTVDWDALAHAAGAGGTLVVLMGQATLGAICERLVAAGLAAGTPAATIENAATQRCRVVRGTVESLPRLVAEGGFAPPVVTVIGTVVGLDLDGRTESGADAGPATGHTPQEQGGE
jgi:siroheme synthase